MGDNYKPAKPGDKDYPSKEAIERAKGDEWSMKYKKSIDCNNPKGFSQKQYCDRQKRGGAYKTDSKYEQMFNDLENK